VASIIETFGKIYRILLIDTELRNIWPQCEVLLKYIKTCPFNLYKHRIVLAGYAKKEAQGEACGYLKGFGGSEPTEALYLGAVAGLVFDKDIVAADGYEIEAFKGGFCSNQMSDTLDPADDDWGVVTLKEYLTSKLCPFHVFAYLKKEEYMKGSMKGKNFYVELSECRSSAPSSQIYALARIAISQYFVKYLEVRPRPTVVAIGVKHKQLPVLVKFMSHVLDN